MAIMPSAAAHQPPPVDGSTSDQSAKRRANSRATPVERGTADERAPGGAAALAVDLERLVALQEGDDRAEWPYEGVYRVHGEIPIGYRVGGTAIVALALITAPGFDGDAARQAAVHRALEFVVQSSDHPLMGTVVVGTYDVRGWGYTYGLTLLLRMREVQLIPPDLAPRANEAIDTFIHRINATEIPGNGGWNYARRAGFDQPGPVSPFMTAPTVQALLDARRQGFIVDQAVIERGLTALEHSRTASGAIAYAGPGVASRDRVPGAIGRMLAVEATLCMAGRSTPAAVRGALDAFINHWQELENRRAKPGTHAAPYGVAPYYFFYAHYYAALAVELLPRHERDVYRSRINNLLFSVQSEDGTWNDRVFPRSAAYGTAMAIMALMMPEQKLPSYAPPALSP